MIKAGITRAGNGRQIRPDELRRVAGPRVSIIIPAYNAGAFIGDAITSALNQTFADLEVIVVDDASSDGTLDLAHCFARQDERVVVLANKARQGPAGARNEALRRARAPWLALLDADDRFARERLATLVPAAEKRGCDFLADNLVLRPNDGGAHSLAFSPSLMSRPQALTLRDFILQDAWPEPSARPLGFSKPIFRHEFVRAHGLQYDLKAFVGQDFVFYFKAIAAGARFCLTPEPLYEFAVGHASHSTGLPALQEIASANARLIHEAGGAEPLIQSALRTRQAKMQFEIFRAHLRRKDALMAMSTLLEVPAHFTMMKLAAALRRRLLGLAV